MTALRVWAIAPVRVPRWLVGIGALAAFLLGVWLG